MATKIVHDSRFSQAIMLALLVDLISALCFLFVSSIKPRNSAFVKLCVKKR